MAVDIEELYDKIYRYCYYRLQNRELAEDVTQETFLRWFASDTYREKNQLLQYLYTVACHLCIDEYRGPASQALPEDVPDGEGDLALSVALRFELDKLPPEDRELLLLRYVNGESMAVLSMLYGQSRFALRRRLNGILKTLRNALE
ncbi:MAG: RNA polymerase sigma factor [Roseburia sp.]|nr:RNA polymerase sigma factor [Roseburia sp.]MCM1097464.1 RNA polymerase sigma factor [Ruminococcus flavefaciens]